MWPSMAVTCWPGMMKHSGRTNSLLITLTINLHDSILPGYIISAIPGNDDLRIFDKKFEENCNKYSFVVCLAQRKFEVEGYEFVEMNRVVDYPFRFKDRCRMDTSDYTHFR